MFFIEIILDDSKGCPTIFSQIILPFKSIRSFFLLCVLLFLSIAGNYFKLHVFWNVDVLFGSIAVLIALRFYGLFWGILAAVISGGYTFFIWNHYVFLIESVCEVLFVGLLLKRAKGNLVFLDCLFWFGVGIPLGWGLYAFLMKMKFATIVFTMLKVSINGIFNALVANVIVSYLPIYKWSPIVKEKRIFPLKHTLFNILLAFTIFPSLVLFYFTSYVEMNRIEKDILNKTLVRANLISSQIGYWHEERLEAVKELASASDQIGLTNISQLQGRLDITKSTLKDITAAYIANSEGTSIAFSPRINAQGKPTAGINYADRAFFIETKSILEPVMSEVLYSRALNKLPVTALVVPILNDGIFNGYAAAVIDLSYIKKQLLASVKDGFMDATIIDDHGKIVASSDVGLIPMQDFNYYPGAEKTVIGDGVDYYVPKLKKNQSKALALMKSFYVREIPIDKNLPWKLILKVPAGNFISEAQGVYTKQLLVVFILIFIAFITTHFVSKKIAKPLVSLTAATTDLPSKLNVGTHIDWPESSIVEILELVSNSKSMANTFKQNFDELQTQYAFLNTMLDTVPNPIFYKDTEGIYQVCNEAFANYVGELKVDVIGKNTLELFDDEQSKKHQQMDDALLKSKGNIMYDFLYKDQHGLMRNAIYHKTTFNNLDGTSGGIVGIIIDITEQKNNERLIWQEKERAQVTLGCIGDAVITTDAYGKVEYLNTVAEDLTGWTNDEACGKKIESIYLTSDEVTGEQNINTVGICIAEDRIVTPPNHTVLTRRDRLVIAIEDSASPIRNREGKIIGSVLVFHDVSEKRALMKKITHQAYHDDLTGLPNRLLFHDRLQQALALAQRNNEAVAVVFLDLDSFKNVNDTMGHAVGDQLLKNVAQVLKQCIRESDTLCRIGGDEFTFLLTQIKNDKDVSNIVTKILKKMQAPWIFDTHEFYITASMGIAMYPNDGTDVETIMKHADTAMFRAKEHGKNSFEFFTSVMNEKVLEKFTLEKSLRKALANKEFVLHYQPILNTEKSKVIGAEALIRWLHPEKGLLPPSDFIPLAEETGLILSIGEWVLRTACAQNVAWLNAGYEPISIAINLSAVQFLKQNLLSQISYVINETGINPAFIELEITESVAMKDVNYTVRTLKALRNLGVRIAIDDFGTGYSSMEYLKTFPINTLKIDKSFIQDIYTDQQDAAIVRTIINLANNLNLGVIAEGVETQEQMQFLKEQNCYIMQGFLFSKPIDAKRFEDEILTSFIEAAATKTI